MGLPTPQQLFRNAALLLNHERRAFRLPDMNVDLIVINALEILASDGRSAAF